MSGDRKSTRTLGSREYLRYYRQKPRPSPANNIAITAELASRFAILIPVLSFLYNNADEEHSVYYFRKSLSHMVIWDIFIFQVQEHGFGHCPIKGATCENESVEANEQIGCGAYA